MEEYFMEIVIGTIFLLLGAVGTLVMIYWKSQSKRSDELMAWLIKLDGKQDKSNEELVVIKTRLEHYDELKQKQDQDHKAIREIDKQVDKLQSEVDNMRTRLEGVVVFCRGEHGMRLPD